MGRSAAYGHWVVTRQGRIKNLLALHLFQNILFASNLYLTAFFGLDLDRLLWVKKW